jgi:hypothetical protein
LAVSKVFGRSEKNGTDDKKLDFADLKSGIPLKNGKKIMSVRRKVKRMKVYDGRKTPSDGNSHDR